MLRLQGESLLQPWTGELGVAVSIEDGVTHSGLPHADLSLTPDRR